MEMTRYEPGTPSWADVSSPDLRTTVDFYRDLFGWNATDMGEETGHYTMFDLGGKKVAAGGPKMPDDPGPAAWTTYVTVADADDIASAITANGGRVVVEPMDVFDAGRMVIATDPSGGFFAAWQPGASIGAERVNEPGTMCWNELTVRDPDAVLPFYGAVFGWTVQVQGGPGAPMVYRELQLDGRTIAGCIQMDDKWPDGIPTHWMVYFAVQDCDAAAARAAELGGSVSVEPFDLPVGRTAVLTDPTGAVFSVIELSAPPG